MTYQQPFSKNTHMVISRVDTEGSRKGTKLANANFHNLPLHFVFYYGGGEAYAWPICRNQKIAKKNWLLPSTIVLRGSNFSHQAFIASPLPNAMHLPPAPSPPFTYLHLQSPVSSCFSNHFH